MKKKIDKVKRYLIICGCAALIFAGLTGCAHGEYNNETDGLSENENTENGVSDGESDEAGSDEIINYEYQQKVDIDENGDGEAEFGFSFSGDED